MNGHEMTVDEVLTTTRTVRRRLDVTRPVPREVIEECLGLALQAPTASNRQEWHWIFVTDPVVRRGLADLYRRDDPTYISLPTPELAEGDVRLASAPSIGRSADFLRQHLEEVPVHLVPCHLGRVDGAPIATQAALWGSLYPAVWSLFLALRSRGLGAAWTSILLRHEREAAELLGVPHDTYTLGGLFPIAYTVGTDFRPAPRRPIAEVLHWDHW
jgi:nitroreductase